MRWLERIVRRRAVSAHASAMGNGSVRARSKRVRSSVVQVKPCNSVISSGVMRPRCRISRGTDVPCAAPVAVACTTRTSSESRAALLSGDPCRASPATHLDHTGRPCRSAADRCDSTRAPRTALDAAMTAAACRSSGVAPNQNEPCTYQPARRRTRRSAETAAAILRALQPLRNRSEVRMSCSPDNRSASTISIRPAWGPPRRQWGAFSNLWTTEVHAARGGFLGLVRRGARLHPPKPAVRRNRSALWTKVRWPFLTHRCACL